MRATVAGAGGGEGGAPVVGGRLVRLLPRQGSLLARWAGWEGHATRAGAGDLDHWIVTWARPLAGGELPERVAQVDLSFRIRKFSKRFR